MSTVLESVPPMARKIVPPPPSHPDPAGLLGRYRASFQRRVAAHVDQRLKALREVKALQGLDGERRTQVLVGMRRLQCQLAGIVVRKQDAMTALLRVSVVALAVYYAVFIPFSVRRLMLALHGITMPERPYVQAIAVLLAGAGTLTLLAGRARRRWGASGRTRLTGTLAAVFYLGYFFAATAVDRESIARGALKSLGIMLLYGLALVLLGAVTLWWGMHITERWWNRHAGARHPDAVVADELLRILETVEKSPAEWGQLRGRNKVLRSLELAARCIERNLPTRLPSQDIHTDQWLRERAAGQAAALRNLKKWVLVPKLDTREHFIRRVSDDLVRTTVGDWDGLECAEPAVARPSRAARAAGVLVPVGLIGLLVVLVQDPTEGVAKLLGAVQPLAVALIPVVGPLLIWAVIRVVNPGMIGELPVIQQIHTMFPARPKSKD